MLTPKEVRALLAGKGWNRVVAFQTRNPLHRAHEYALVYGLETLLREGFNAGACLNPLIGEVKGDDVNAEIRMQTYEKLITDRSLGDGDSDSSLWGPRGESVPDRVVLLGLDIKMFYGGPKEAVMHGIYRQNMGYTHLVIGRKHADAPYADGEAIWGDFDAQEIFEKLSGGERRRVALCRLLLSNPDMLLLDEPTNHLDAESVAWLERFLKEFPGTVIAVTHDRYFLDNVAGWILELDRGHGIPFEGNYSSWLEQKQARLAVEEKQASARQRTLARELEWVQSSPKARQAKSKARLAAYEQMLAEEQNVKLDTVEIHIPPGPRLGDVVVVAEHVRKGFGDRLLIEDLSFTLPPNGIVGIIGANGAGKTTLFRMIAGQEELDGGSIAMGETVQLAYVDQSRADLDPEKNVWEEISGGLDIIHVGEREGQSRAYVASFNFKGADQQKKVGMLSGGERNRVHLAKLLKSGGNLLLLDEPTNDLDVDTLRALEVALNDFPGCAVVITHDRWFLDRVATHILAFEGDSQVTWFEGSWGEYAAWVTETRGAEALEPHRIRYKPLVRP